jgi:hypothetical protein
MPAESIDALGGGCGLLHALSGTCALDLDDLAAARAWWAEHSVDIDALRNDPNSVHITSGRAGRDKLLYNLSKPLRTIKPKGSGFELRCATAGGESVQDVLPPSVHPLTKRPYQWAYGEPLLGHWSNLPNIPAGVYRVWREMADAMPVREVVNTTAAPATFSTIRVREAALVKMQKLDIDEYDDWINIGQSIHKETRGHTQGLALWDELSKAGKKYKGRDDLETHWVSFDIGGARGLNTAASAEEFEVIKTPSADEEIEAVKTKQLLRSEALALLESRFLFVKTAEKYFDLHDHRLVFTEASIQTRFTPYMPGKCNPIKLLRESKTKRIVDSLGFHPGKEVVFDEGGDTYANLYRGRLPDPLEPTALEREKIEWLFNRIDDVLYRSWLLQLYGHVVQKPGVKIRTAPLIWSTKQGNGKSTLVGAIPALLVGEAYSVEVNAAVLTSDFNDILCNAWHVNLVEFRGASRAENQSISKKVENWIADSRVNLHQKGVKAMTMPNHFFVTASSNAEDAAQIDFEDRKWGVCNLQVDRMTDQEVAWIYPEFLLTPRAAAVLRHYFMAIDLTGFNPDGRAPLTAAKQEMVDINTSPELDVLIHLHEERSPPFDRDVVRSSDVQRYMQQNCTAKPTASRIGRILTRAPFNGVVKIFFAKGGTHRAIVLYNHARWKNATGPEIMAHIEGDDISVEDPLLS